MSLYKLKSDIEIEIVKISGAEMFLHTFFSLLKKEGNKINSDALNEILKGAEVSLYTTLFHHNKEKYKDFFRALYFI